MTDITPYLVTFRHMVEQTGQTSIAAATPEDARKGAEKLLKKFGLDAEILDVKEYEEEAKTLAH